MARSYAPLLTSTWADADFRALSGDAQRIYLLALSQPNMTYAGVVPYTSRRWARMASDTKPADIDEAVEELILRRFVVLDDETEELFVRSFVKHNGVLQQPQLRKAMVRAFGEILSPSIRAAFRAELPESARTLLAPCPQPSGTLSEGCAAPAGQEPSPEPEPSSSSSTTEDDEEDRITSAMLILADRVMALRVAEKGPLTDPDAWVAKVARTRRERHLPIAQAHLEDDPAISAEDLARELEPGLFPPKPSRPRPPCDLCQGSTWIPDDEFDAVHPCPNCRPDEIHR